MRYIAPNGLADARRVRQGIAWNTGSSSPGELLITWITSEVAALLRQRR